MIERGRSRGRAEAWRPWIAAGRRPALAWPHGLTDFVRRAAQRVREWAAVEAAPGRLVPWLAIGFGSGTIIYFAVEREPALSAAALLLAATVAAAILCRRRPFAFPACVGVAAVAAGFATGAIKREIIAHPVRRHGTSSSQASSRCGKSASARTAWSFASSGCQGRD
jgi:competence protein ComEC